MTLQLEMQFDYGSLDSETRIVVQQRTTEIKGLMRRAAQDIIDIGQKLIEVKERLGHGNFGGWLKAEFQWTDRTARQFMQVADRFKSENFSDLSIAPSALYLLAAPSTPEEARDEAIARAQSGETITHAKAQEIIADRRIADLSEDERTRLIKRLAAKRLRWTGGSNMWDSILVSRDIEYKDDAKERYELSTLADAERVLKLPVPPAPPSRWARTEPTAAIPHLPDDWAEMQQALGDAGTLAMDDRTGRFRIIFPDGDAVSYPDWDGMKAHIAALNAPEDTWTAEEEAADEAAVQALVAAAIAPSGFVQQIEDAAAAAAISTPADFHDIQERYRGIATIAITSGGYQVVLLSGKTEQIRDWDAVKRRLFGMKAGAYSPPADFFAVRERLGDRGTLSLNTATGVFYVTAPGEEPVFFQDDDFHLRWRLTKEHCARLRQREATTAHTPLPTPPAGWSLWQDNDETYGMAHDCGIKLRGTSPTRLVDEAREMSIWIERLKGWFVTLDIAGTGWQATHEEYGQVFADDLPTLALRAFWHAATARDLPDLPDYVISAAFLAGWTYKRTEGSYYIYTEGRFTLGELLYELKIPEPQAPAPAPAEPEPEPDATAEQRAILVAWLTDYLCILRAPVQRMLAQTLVPASTQPWADTTAVIRAAMAAKIVAAMDAEMLHQCMGREGVGR